MTIATPQQFAQSASLEELYGKLAPAMMVPGWAKTAPSLWPEPKKSFQAHCWAYDQAKGALDAATFEVGTAYLPDGPAGGGTPTGGTGVAISSSSTPEEQLAAAMFLEFLTNTENTALFSQSTGYMPVRTSAVESDTMTAIYEQTPQFRTAVDQLADKARIQDDVRVFVPGADALLNDAIEQIVIEGTDPATAFESITPQIERAYEENVEPYL